MDTSFSCSFRVAACDACGAPHEAAVDSGGFSCHYCKAFNTLLVRNESVVAPGRAKIAEAERLTRLRSQVGRPLLPPPSLEHLMTNGQLAEWKVDEAVSIWNGARQALRAQPSDIDAAERLVFLSMMVAQHFKHQGDNLRRRALLEGALDVVTLPRHRQILRGFLTRAAVIAGDFEAAEAWLEPCDHVSDDLSMDSEWRFSRAFIDTAQGDFQGVLTVLGSGPNNVPIEDASLDVCAVLRANAFERLGQVDVAVNLLRDRFRAGGGARHTMRRVIQAYPDWQLCAQSYPQTVAIFAKDAGTEAASLASGGGLQYVSILLGIGLMLGGLWRFWTGLTSFFGQVDPQVLEDRWAELGFGVVIGLLGLCFAAFGFATKKSAEKKKWLHMHGLEASGQIQGTAPTGMSIGDDPVMRYTLLVSVPGRAPYQATVSHVSQGSQGVLSGIVSLRVHPEDPKQVVIEG